MKFCGALAAVVAAIGFTLRAGAGTRAFTIEDGIAAVRSIDPSRNGREETYAPQVSPDGRAVFVVTLEGDLQRNEIVTKLLVFRAKNESDGLHRRVHADTAAILRSTVQAGILEPRWLGNDAVGFLCPEVGGTPQVCSVSVREGEGFGQIEKRTDLPAGVDSYFSNEKGDIVVVSRPVSDARQLAQIKGSGYLVDDTHAAIQLSSEVWEDTVPRRTVQAYVVRRDRRRAEILEDVLIEPHFNYIVRFWLSPSGSHAVGLLPANHRAGDWQAYNNASIRKTVELLGQHRNGTAYSLGYPLLSFVYIDLRTGQVTPFPDAPARVHDYERLCRAIVQWSPDERSILLANVMLPLSLAEKLEEPTRRRALSVPAILTLDVQRRIPEIVTFVDRFENANAAFVAAAKWNTAGIEIEQASRIGDTQEHVQFSATPTAGWQPGATRRTSHSPYESSMLDGLWSVSVSETYEQPPKVHIRNRRSGEVVFELDLNPQFRTLHLTPIEILTWIDEVGQSWSGGLVYPDGYIAGRAYPLVIQTHGFSRREFLIDGQMIAGGHAVEPGAYSGQSARALAANGFFILQEHELNPQAARAYGTSQEGPQYIRSYRAVVEQLDRRGLIDRDKVGIQGFSRTVYHAKYALAHAPELFAAASLTDGLDFGYMQMISAGADLSLQKTAQGIYGSRPIGDGLKSWLVLAPTFNADKINTPTRIEAITARGVGPEWEMYTLLRMAHVPTEMFVYPTGAHRLLKPRERLLSQQGAINWFCFWLRGETCVPGMDSERVDRWRTMRSRWTNLLQN